jgi:CheY-like chemotaxis protein
MEHRFKHILLADDDQDHAFLFDTIVRKLYPDKALSIVNDGNDLFEYLKQHLPDLIFLDLNMPCKNGIECLNELKSNPAYRSIPVIVYSSSAHLNDIQDSYVHKADFYMVKPFSVKHLELALENIFSMDWNAGSPINQHYYINNRFVPFTATG